ncbi:MAG: hypothetical protein A4E53_01476 [Pelotomaculum sp. PtaB.Bin104]|nr:MAG: hypothetical protein A4E53_01476 [Pelotomaculum sp. PtaB.Bin104]
MTALVYVCALMFGFAVFYAIVGNRISLRSRYVKYKDQRIENAQTAKKTSDLLVSIAGAVICAGLTLAVTGTWYYSMLGLSGGYFVSKWWKARKEQQRMELLQDQYSDVLGQIESAIYGGLNPYQAIEDAVPDMPRPSRDVFYEILRRTRAGDTLANAIDNVRKETGWNDLKVLSMGMNMYSRIGCDLGVVCRHALESIEDKESSRSVISAAIAQNMMTLKILTALPFLIVGAARAISPAFSYPLFHTIEGSIVFVFSVVWIAIGNIVTRKMVFNALGRGV